MWIGFCIFYPDEYPNREIYYRDKEPIQKNFGRRSIIGFADLYFPPLYGEGYSSLEALLTDNADALLNNTYFFDFRNYAFVVVLYVIGLVFIKVVATAFTNGMWGVGGVFAPSLFTGGVTGFLIAYLSI